MKRLDRFSLPMGKSGVPERKSGVLGGAFRRKGLGRLLRKNFLLSENNRSHTAGKAKQEKHLGYGTFLVEEQGTNIQKV